MNSETENRGVAEVVERIRGSVRIAIRGAGTKAGLLAGNAAATVDLRSLSGIADYDPGEFTITALAGTPVAEIAAALAKHGQHLPFDPPLLEQGATIGGTIAAGLSGPGRYRFGGVRDFILQARFVTGKGELVRGGAKVVKNAAGFDLPKLLVGSLGRLGAIVEATFKVFPRARAYATLEAEMADIPRAADSVMRLGRSFFDIEALEVDPPGTIRVRLGGERDTFQDRFGRLGAFVAEGGARPSSVRIFEGEQESDFWAGRRARCGGFLGGPRPAAAAVKIPLTPKRVPRLDARLAEAGADRFYTAGMQAAWVAWPGEVSELDSLLRDEGLSGLVVQAGASGSPSPFIGARTGTEFLRRVKAALDPDGKFGPF